MRETKEKTMQERPYPTGGQFLLEDTAPEDVFTPEDFDENQRMIGQTVADFVEKEVLPLSDVLARVLG